MDTKIEIYSHEVTRSRQGAVARITWICDWSERSKVRPKINSPHPTESGLYCTEVRETGLGKPTGDHEYEYCRIEASYSTYQQVDAAPIETWEFAGEVLETGYGRIWRDARTETGQTVHVDQSFGVLYPTAIRTLTVVRLDIPVAAILQNIGKVNWTTWQGCGPETCLFEGASSESWYDYERRKYFYRISYRFLIRSISHNVVWRAPMQARDRAGNLLYDDRGPVWVGGTAGQGGWDRPEPPLYEWGDFNPLIGLPPNPPPLQQ